MFGLTHLGRRLVESVVGLFAILGFIYVPLGRHTGFEHAKAILGTPAASAAIDDLTRTALSLRERAFDFLTGRLSASAATLPPPGTDSAKQRPGTHEPHPVPPKLK
ncbi:MAG TPA: hypothetical protein VHB79_18970 [Polyangiaceae bacterium]|nr:hypothetical protein [Polyangiaceae bacterium]